MTESMADRATTASVGMTAMTRFVVDFQASFETAAKRGGARITSLVTMVMTSSTAAMTMTPFLEVMATTSSPVGLAMTAFAEEKEMTC